MLTQTQREELANCDECMSAQCEICGHEPCLGCLDDCDHCDCLVEKEGTQIQAIFLEKTHKCVFKRCEKHKNLSTIIDIP